MKRHRIRKFLLGLLFVVAVVLPAGTGTADVTDQIILSFRINDAAVETGDCAQPGVIMLVSAADCVKYNTTEGNWSITDSIWIERIEFALFATQTNGAADCTIFVDTGSLSNYATAASTPVATMGDGGAPSDLEEDDDTHTYTYQASVGVDSFFRFRFADRVDTNCTEVKGLSINVIGHLELSGASEVEQIILAFRINDTIVETGDCAQPDAISLVPNASCSVYNTTEGNWSLTSSIWIERIEFYLFNAQTDDVADCEIYMDTGSIVDLAIDDSVEVATMGNLAPAGPLEEKSDYYVYTHQASVAANTFYRFRFVDRGLGVCEQVKGLSINVIGYLE